MHSTARDAILFCRFVLFINMYECLWGLPTRFWGFIGAGLSSIDGRATTRSRMKSCYRFQFSPEEANIDIIADVVELIGPRLLPVRPEQPLDCERTFRLPEGGGNLSFLLALMMSTKALPVRTLKNDAGFP